MSVSDFAARLEASLLGDWLTLGQRQFVRFLVVGALNTAVGYSLFVLFVLLKLGPGTSLALATALGVLFNYMTTGRLVFAARGLGRLPFFAAVYGLTFLLNLWSLRFFLSSGFSPILAQAILLPPMVVLNFALNKIFVFRPARLS
jgi:putative flippase GtrA